MTTNTTVVLPAMTDETSKNMSTDAANARAEARLGTALAPYWDAVVAANPNAKRSAVVKSVLVAAGLWRKDPQAIDGERTPFGNVVQRFGARFDAAVKRAKGDDSTPVDYLRLVRQAVESAAKHDITPDTIATAVADVLATMRQPSA